MTIRGKAASHGVFCYTARVGKMKKISWSAGLGANAAHAESAERLAIDNRPGAPSVDIQVAHFKLLSCC